MLGMQRSVLRTSLAIKRMMSNYVVLGNDNALSDIVKSKENKVLYFTATWCPPCKFIAPIFEKLSKEYSTTKFVKIDIDDNGEAASEYMIRGVPTFIFFKGDKENAKFTGASEEALRKHLNDLK